MSPLVKIDTGVHGLDELMLGGIPEGRATLLAGRSGTGKTVLGLQMAAHFASRGLTTIHVAVEESPRDLRDSGDALGLGMSQLMADGKLRFADSTRADGVRFVSGDY